MTRVSLTEAYDNKDVIQQIYRLTDEMDSGTIKDFQASKDASTGVITIALTLNDDTVKSYTIPSVDGVTLDTDQTVTGRKVFANAGGLQVSHDLDVDGDLNAGSVETNEITVDTDATVKGNFEVDGTAKLTRLVVDKITASTQVTVPTVPATDTSTNAASTSVVDDKLTLHDASSKEITGGRTFNGNVIVSSSASTPLYIDSKGADRSLTAPPVVYQTWIQMRDKNFLPFGYLQCVLFTNGHRSWQLTLHDKDGGEHVKVLFEIDADGNVIQ